MLLRITRSTETTIHIMSFFFLPGVILHELAHWFVAGVLLVPTGEMEFMPQIQGNTVKLGSVAIGQTDPLRRFLIGVAPIIIGLTAMFGLFAYFANVVPAVNWQTAVVGYLFFEIGNTMFSSTKDMEGAIALGIFVAIICALIYFLGLRVNLSGIETFFIQPVIVGIFQKVDAMLLFPIVINILLYTPSVWRK